MKCFNCKKEIKEEPIIHGVDGDFMCSEECIKKWEKECEIINQMTDKEFEYYMKGR